MTAYLKDFADIPSYGDPGSQNQTCRDILPRGVVPGLSVGHDRTEGPGHNALGNHSDWHQVFVVIGGSGTLLRGEERVSIQAPCVIHIPPNTDHNVFVEEGQYIEYIYVNKYLTEDE